ncbi:MAG: hypothetical protein HQM13_23205 [SAR324 cluster bacterium]|nr:hypothetical protein [SAR324 cluster bacterium]
MMLKILIQRIDPKINEHLDRKFKKLKLERLTPAQMIILTKEIIYHNLPGLKR